MVRKLLYLTVLVAFFGCTQNRPKLVEPPAPVWQQKTVSKTNCSADSVGCVEFEATYVYFSGSDELSKKLNAVTDSFVTALVNLEEDSTIMSPETAAQKLIGLHEKAKEEDFGGVMSWSVHLDSEVPFSNDQFLTLDLRADNYLGGAHPNAFRNVLTYDRVTAMPVDFGSLVADKTKLTSILEARYKTEKGLDASSDLKEVTFDGSPLPLPANIALVQDGLLFYYNDYEVAPHAVGPTEIKLTWLEMQGMVKELPKN